jgi:hypothetical protein
MSAIVRYVEALDAAGEKMLRNLRSFDSWVRVIPERTTPSHFEVQLLHPGIADGAGRRQLETLLDARYPDWRSHVRLP